MTRNPTAAWLKGLLVVAICAFYAWTAVPEWRPNLIAPADDGYYNLLIRGFLKGHLYLDTPADPFLATLSNPWDIGQRGEHGLPDSSYFRGHYYIYHGVTPALVLFLPVHLLTGRYLGETLANPVFACAGFVLSAWLLCAMARRYFSKASGWIVGAGVLALGLGDMMPVLLRRPGLREVPIVCGYACCAAGLAALFNALHGRCRHAWLAGASLAFGLAVGSRPLYLLACPVVLLPLWAEARGRPGPEAAARQFPWWKGVLAATLPMALVGIGLALYNFGRFGALTEFGLRYQLWYHDPAKTVFFAWRFLPYNLWAYWTASAGWVRYFPFVTFVPPRPVPQGFYGVEDTYGILTNMPFAALAGGLLAFLVPRSAGGDGRGRLVIAAVAWATLAMVLPLLFLMAALNRYMVDFAPLVMLTAALGACALANRGRWRGMAGGAASVAVCALAGYSALFNVLASWRHNELFRAEYPAIYARVAHRWNWLSYAYDRWRGTAYGPLELKVTFPPDRVGSLEPLVVTGHSFLSDYLFVNYLAPNLIQFELEHTSRGVSIGAPLPIVPGKAYDVRVDLASLYPPAADPYFDGMPPTEALKRQNLVEVTVDGRLALYAIIPTYDATGPEPSLGSSGDRGPFPDPFSGRILSHRRLANAALDVPKLGQGSLRLNLRLPAFSGRHDEPLFTSGETGRGDMIYLHYESPTRIAFGYAHGDAEPLLGPLMVVEPAAAQAVGITFDGLQAMPGPTAPKLTAGTPSGLLLVHLNGRAALATPAPYFPAGAGTFALGLNAIHAAPAADSFTGNFIDVGQEPEAGAPPAAGPYELRLRFPAFQGARSEPLLCDGESGRGDLIYVRYLSATQISFGLDHWGGGGLTSPPCAVDLLADHVVEIDFGSMHPAAAGLPNRHLTIRLDGRTVMDEPAPFYPAAPGAIAVGLNPIHASTASATFTGVLVNVSTAAGRL